MPFQFRLADIGLPGVDDAAAVAGDTGDGSAEAPTGGAPADAARTKSKSASLVPKLNLTGVAQAETAEASTATARASGGKSIPPTVNARNASSKRGGGGADAEDADAGGGSDSEGSAAGADQDDEHEGNGKDIDVDDASSDEEKRKAGAASDTDLEGLTKKMQNAGVEQMEPFWWDIPDTPIDRHIRTKFRMTGLIPEGSFMFRVRSRNIGGWSAWSPPSDLFRTSEMVLVDDAERVADAVKLGFDALLELIRLEPHAPGLHVMVFKRLHPFFHEDPQRYAARLVDSGGHKLLLDSMKLNRSNGDVQREAAKVLCWAAEPNVFGT